MAYRYAIVDTAQDPKLYDLVIAASEHACLFAGPLDPVLRRASPHIVLLQDGGALAQAWESQGQGHNWGIRCESTADLAHLRRHFRHFLQAKLPDGKVVLFRFYDPRVWRVYLPTCSEFELRQWFRNIEAFEAEAPQGHGRVSYVLNDGKLDARAMQ